MVVIEGAKASGETWVGRNRACSEASFGQDEQARAQARLLPRQFLAGSEPRLIDEWQIVPEIWNSIRHSADGKIDAALAGSPVRKVVTTDGGFGYDRPDGAAVVPLTALTVSADLP